MYPAVSSEDIFSKYLIMMRNIFIAKCKKYYFIINLRIEKEKIKMTYFVDVLYEEKQINKIKI